jgi:hypothetical protein
MINEQVHSNLALNCATFDFAAHVQHRSYAVHDYFIGDFQGTALFDEGVERLLPDSFEPSPPSPMDLVEIINTGKKGFGMLARRDIPAQGLILIEHPVVVTPYLIGLTTPLSDLYAQLFNRLPPKLHRDLMRLANCKSVKECSLFEGIVRTNAIGIQLDVPDVPHPELSTHRAIFLNTSRCNHRLVSALFYLFLGCCANLYGLPNSCSPNAKWEWDTLTFSLYLSAVRPIRLGEEITIQYISSVRPWEERQASLRSLYGFTCYCSACTLPSSIATLKSDQARATLDQFWSTLPTFEEWCLDTSMPDDILINAHAHALKLIEHEGLQVLDCGKHVDAIAMCYGAMEDVEMFRSWTEKVRDLKVRTNPKQAIVFAKWLSNPMAFPAWGWRRTFCGSRGSS